MSRVRGSQALGRRYKFKLHVLALVSLYSVDIHSVIERPKQRTLSKPYQAFARLLEALGWHYQGDTTTGDENRC